MDGTLIVGLGNPGSKYAETRHNVGFRCVELLASRHRINFNRRQAEALVASGIISGQAVVLAKPQTFMNLSGRSVRGLLGSLGLGPQNLIVVHDDLDLPMGKLRVRAQGSAGGNRGVQSIIDSIGTNDFRRVRVGIGRPVHGDAIDYVLEPFGPDDAPLARLAFQAAVEAVECLIQEGLEATMNRFNKLVTPS